MNEAEVLDITKDCVLVLVKVVSPLLFTGMIVGLFISIFQTLTSIQEMTLVFVPKVLAVFIAIILFMPFMLKELTLFTYSMFDRMLIAS
ncbi:MAG: flagellar biosynthesis protein FliQ [Alphaproteobacteria bacterium]|nr:flagellar biosynthesis protein FliQ [Alphaproteobacteria bacterium]